MTHEANCSPINFSEFLPEEDALLLMAIGSLRAVNTCRHRLHQLGYADAGDWSDPQPAGSGKVMRVLTKILPPAPPAVEE